MPKKLTVKNQSVEKIFLIIETMARSSAPMRLQDIAENAAIPASTALRFINTLSDLGYVHQDPLTLRYSLTLKFTQLGDLVASQISIRDIARPYLMELSKQCEETCCLAEEQGMEIVYQDVLDNPEYLLRIIQRPGVRAPMYCTGIGKLLLLNKSEAELEAYVKLKNLEYHTEKTITSHAALIKELAKIRSQGYAIDDEENELGVKSVAAPILDCRGKTLCGISVAGPATRLAPERIQEILPHLKETARKISLAVCATE